MQSLSFRLTLFSVLLFGLLAFAIPVFVTRSVEAALVDSIALSAKRTSRVLFVGMSLPASTGDYQALQTFFAELFRGDQTLDLRYLALADEQQHLLLSAGQLGADGLPPPSPAIDVSSPDRTYHVRQPILLADNQVGLLQYGLELDQLVKANESLRGQIAPFVVLAVLLLGIVQLWLSRHLARRVRLLLAATEAVSSGQFDHRIHHAGRDELGLLARNFNRMADTIGQKIAALEQARRDVETLNAELEQRVQVRTVELAGKNQALEQTLTQLSNARQHLVESEKLAGLGALVAGISHELNTPIGNALTITTTLNDEVRTLQQAVGSGMTRSQLERFLQSANEASDILHRNLDRAAELIHSFKRVAVDQTSAQRRQFALAEMLRELLQTLQPLFKHRAIRLDAELADGIAMDAYPGPLGQIITNLITNALNHGFDGRDSGHIRLTASRPADQPGAVDITVEDDGIGMNDDTLRRIYEPFFTTKLGRGGSGLGMNIVYSLVTGLMGGNIHIDSEPGHGTRVRLQLPCVAPAATAMPAPVGVA